jgi:DUF1365 family protein
MTASCVYEGWVRHRRHGEVEHELRFPLFMAYLDLDELPEVLDGRPLWSARRPAPAWFRRADHLGDPSRPLAETITSLVAGRTGRRPDGPIRLLTNLRYLGHCFNPVSFYYCFDATTERVAAVVAEVTNTPWGERHAYVLDADPAERAPGAVVRGRLEKTFHVSPFMGMDHTYDWRLTEPSERLHVHIESERQGEVVFDATLSLERRPLSTGVLLRHPALTMQVVAGIYGQALGLWRKGARYHPHPSDTPVTGAARRERARRSRVEAGGAPGPPPRRDAPLDAGTGAAAAGRPPAGARR